MASGSGSASILIYAEPQPSPGTWARAQELVERWNEEHEHRWELLDAGIDSSYSLELDTDAEEFRELTALLERNRDEHGLEFEVHVGDVTSADEYAEADFVLLYGAELHAQSLEYAEESGGHRAFVVKEQENWEPGRPCPGCGWVDPVHGQQRGPFVVDEWYLDREYDPEAATWKHADRDWDILSLPGGVILVSRGVAEALAELGATGYETGDVVSSDTGEPSPRILELQPNRWIKEICTEHSDLKGETCPECGRILGKLSGPIYLREEWIGDDDIIGRNPGHRFIYFAQHVYAQLDAMEAKGMVASERLCVCAHDE